MTADRVRALVSRPIVVAPMAGGPSTPALVAAAGEAGALGFLAAGYKTPEALSEEIEAVAAMTSTPYGVNVFVPGRRAAQTEEVARYVESLAPDAEDLGVAVFR